LPQINKPHETQSNELETRRKRKNREYIVEKVSVRERKGEIEETGGGQAGTSLSKQYYIGVPPNQERIQLKGIFTFFAKKVEVDSVFFA
jgi:hypothetical protein